MRVIKFTMSKGEPYYVNEDKAVRILSGEDQLVMITDDTGKWTGQTINKAHIVGTDVDTERTKDLAMKNALPEPKEPPLTEEQKEKNRIAKQKINVMLHGKKVKK